MKILILGAGVFGEALGKIATYNGHETSFYDPIKYPSNKLEDLVSGKDAIIYAAPSDKFQEILPNLPTDTPLICASKGFLSIEPFKNFKSFSALGGAAFAEQIIEAITELPDEEIEKNRITFTASSELSEQVFSTEIVKVEYTKDTLGILLCGALKNIYAIGAGINGVASKYLTAIAQEMRDILIFNNANPETLKLSCGIPDLPLTCTPNSRNFRFGEAIKTHKAPENTTIEGLAIIKDLNNFPDFILPKSATVIKDIIKKVEKYEEEYAAK